MKKMVSILMFFITSSILAANPSQDKVYDFYQLKKDQRPVFIIKEKQESNSIDLFTRSANRSHGANSKTIVDSIIVSSEQKVFNISFIVDKEGKVKEIISDSESERVRELIKILYGIETEGKWIPGKIDGSPIDVKIPFTISLRMGFISLILKEW